MSTLHLKAWNFLFTPIDALSIIRHLSSHFPGSQIAEYRVYRDRNLPNQYQTYLDVRFRRPIKLDSEKFILQVPLTRFREYKLGSGGISLEDFRWLLRPYNKETYDQHTIDPETNKPYRILDVEVTHARTEFFTLGQSTPPASSSSPFSREFVKWGGFAKFEPNPVNSPFTDHISMRSSLREHASLAGIENPFELRPPPPPPPVEPNWEPIPQPAKKQAPPPPLPRKERQLINKNLPQPTVSADQLLSSKKPDIDKQEVANQVKAMKDLLNSKKKKRPAVEIIEPTVVDEVVVVEQVEPKEDSIFEESPVLERIEPKQEHVAEESTDENKGGLSFLKSFLMRRKAPSS